MHLRACITRSSLAAAVYPVQWISAHLSLFFLPSTKHLIHCAKLPLQAVCTHYACVCVCMIVIKWTVDRVREERVMSSYLPRKLFTMLTCHAVSPKFEYAVKCKVSPQLQLTCLRTPKSAPPRGTPPQRRVCLLCLSLAFKRNFKLLAASAWKGNWHRKATAYQSSERMTKAKASTKRRRRRRHCQKERKVACKKSGNVINVIDIILWLIGYASSKHAT